MCFSYVQEKLPGYECVDVGGGGGGGIVSFT